MVGHVLRGRFDRLRVGSWTGKLGVGIRNGHIDRLAGLVHHIDLNFLFELLGTYL